MIMRPYFACFILSFNLYTVVMGQFKKLSCGPERTEKERLLEKFLMGAETHLMQNCPSRHTTILAPNNQLLRAATPIFKGRPYFVGTNSKILVQSREYANENCVFVFIDAIDYDYLSTIFSPLPKNYITKVQIVSTKNLRKHEVKNVLDLAYDKSIENITITFLDNNEFKAFQVFPYTRNCKREVRLLYVWAPDKGFQTYNYDDYSPGNLNKCPISISTMFLEDIMVLHENSDGELHVLGGLEGNLMLTFAEKLNFTAVVKYPEIPDWEAIVNNTIVGLLGDIVNKKSLIAFGQLRPTLNRHKYSDFTQSYNPQCIVWTTPVVTTSIEDVVYSELNKYLWTAVIFSVIFSCIFVYNLSKISSSNHEKKAYIEVTLDVICATLQMPLHRVPANQPGKIYYLSYIFYAMIVTVAYKTSLASILTVSNDVQLIKNDDDIIRSGLTVGGSKSALSLLQSQQEENPNIPYMIEHYEIVLNIVNALDRIKQRKDFAYIRHLSTMQHYKRSLILSGEDVYFYSFNECVVSYHTVALVSKGCALTKELNRIINSVLEFGIMSSWNSEKDNLIFKHTYADDVKIQKLTFSQLQTLFILYLSGIFLSTFIMILEIIFGTLLKRN